MIETFQGLNLAQQYMIVTIPIGVLIGLVLVVCTVDTKESDSDVGLGAFFAMMTFGVFAPIAVPATLFILFIRLIGFVVKAIRR